MIIKSSGKLLKSAICILVTVGILAGCLGGCSSGKKDGVNAEDSAAVSENDNKKEPDSESVSFLKSMEFQNPINSGDNYSYDFEWAENSVVIKDSSDSEFGLEIGFDRDGKITSASAVHNGEKTQESFVYENGCLVKAELQYPAGKTDKNVKLSFEYKDGRVSSNHAEGPYTRKGTGLFTYDEKGRLISSSDENGNINISLSWQKDHAEAYDSSHNKIGTAEFSGGKCISAKIYDYPMVIDYEYDNNGYLIAQSFDHELNEYDKTICFDWGSSGTSVQAAVSQIFIRAINRIYSFYENDPEAEALYYLLNP